MEKTLGFILMMDVTDSNSIATAREISKKLVDLASQKALKVLVTNKVDLANRAFSSI